jgi:hypothetical protein
MICVCPMSIRMYYLGRIQFLGKLGGPGLPLRVIIGQ